MVTEKEKRIVFAYADFVLRTGNSVDNITRRMNIIKRLRAKGFSYTQILGLEKQDG